MMDNFLEIEVMDFVKLSLFAKKSFIPKKASNFVEDCVTKQKKLLLAYSIEVKHIE
jgi:hypothetical protein